MENNQLHELIKEAFIYGYPIVDMYNILYKYTGDTNSPEYKAPFNTIAHNRYTPTPEDRAIVAPNCDTPYSFVWLDLRAEPIVLTIPTFAADRYVSLMLNDLYTYIFGYVTPRTNGQAGGDFLIAGPDWAGDMPPGIRRVFHSSTQLALAMYRTQLLTPDDIAHVRAIQDQFIVQPLSHYLGTPPPAPAPACNWIEPIDVRREPTSPQFFAILNWMLQYMPVLAEETALRQRFEASGVGPGAALSPEIADPTLLAVGMQAGLGDMMARLKTVRSSGELFGSREFLGDDYLIRAVGAMAGILGNSQEEYMGIGYHGDANGRPFDGQYAYQIKFGPDQLPPVKAFWSITLYDAHSFLYANPLHRYVVNSPMIDQLTKDADGGFTLIIRHDSPGVTRESNWLPVPPERFGLTFRCYQPDEAILNFSYTAPPVIRLEQGETDGSND